MILQYYLEDLLLELARRNKIDPENYSIPTDPKEFHGLIVRGNNEFQRFLQDLIKTNDEETVALRKWIMEEIEYKYPQFQFM